ncbi:hypothetical protein NKR23_g9499 [Pleurostoma richardsiae]|uniref:Uncharacterized protein n=1 Tax=Pleurostoma richardsiae TaxID=41990 RepID=A0AA38R6L9_9PEZI|nr:hypothetical protein NKR23_g9499 [Pleurostoma richardsiae]
MGLALQDPASSLAHLADQRHLSPGPARDKPSARLSRARAHSLQLRHVRHAGICAQQVSDRACHGHDLYPHQLAALAAACYRTPPPGYRSYFRGRRGWAADADEGHDLARSGDPLPSDGDRSRPPSLERQEAFRDARTAKRQCSSSSSTCLAEDDDDDAELYRLGLLYDDEHERGPGFSLDAVVHDEPAYAYSVNFRQQGKRGQKRKVEEHGTGTDGHFELPLNLSFSRLADDEAIARFLISPLDEEVVDIPGGEETQDNSDSTHAVDATLKIIYELDDSARFPSASLRSYSSFSSDATIPPQCLETQLPDLISDFSDYGDDGNDWADLGCPDDISNAEAEGDEEAVTHADDAGADSAPDGESRLKEEEAEESPDAWIMLG